MSIQDSKRDDFLKQYLNRKIRSFCLKYKLWIVYEKCKKSNIKNLEGLLEKKYMENIRQGEKIKRISKKHIIAAQSKPIFIFVPQKEELKKLILKAI